MENYSDILFAGIERKEAYEHKSLEMAYGFYKSAYNYLAQNLSHAIYSDNWGGQGVEKLLSSVFHYKSSRKDDDITILVYRYRDFLRQFSRLFDENDDVFRQLIIRGIDKNEIEFWRVGMGRYEFFNMQQRTGMVCLQFMMSSKYVVETLTSIYKHFCKNSIVSRFAYEGCKLLGVTWADFVFSIRQAAYGLIINPIYEAIQNILNCNCVQQRVLNTKFSPFEKIGAAFAEYPYGFVLMGVL